MPILPEHISVGRYAGIGGVTVQVVAADAHSVSARIGFDLRVADFARATIARIIRRRLED